MDTTHPDQRFITALLNNDARVITEIYAGHMAKIMDTIRRMGGTEHDAWDVLQESLLALTMRARKGNFVLTCPFEAFLVIVCKNRWINHIERMNRRKGTILPESGSTSLDQLTAQEKTAIEILHEYEMHKLIQRCLATLNPACQKLLRLILEDKNLTETSEILGKTYKSTKKSKFECEKKLIEAIKATVEYKELMSSHPNVDLKKKLSHE